MTCPTTRQHPRTLAQAFPHDATYASAIERCDNRVASFGIVMLACGVAVVASVIAVVWVLP